MAPAAVLISNLSADISTRGIVKGDLQPATAIRSADPCRLSCLLASHKTLDLGKTNGRKRSRSICSCLNSLRKHIPLQREGPHNEAAKLHIGGDKHSPPIHKQSPPILKHLPWRAKNLGAGPLRTSCWDLAEASDDVALCERHLAFLQSATRGGVKSKEVTERWPMRVDAYISSQASDEDFPDRLREPPLLNLGQDRAATSSRTENGVSDSADAIADVMQGGPTDKDCERRATQLGEGVFRRSSTNAAVGNKRASSLEVLDVERRNSLGTSDWSQAYPAETSLETQSVQSEDPPETRHLNNENGAPSKSSLQTFERARVSAEALLEGGEPQRLVELLECLKERGHSPDTICKPEAAIDLLAQTGSVNLALRWIGLFPQSGALYSQAMRAFPSENTSLFWGSLVERIRKEGDMPAPRDYALVAKALLRWNCAEFVDFVCAFKGVSACSTRDFCSNETVFKELARNQNLASAIKFLHHGMRPSRLGTEYAKAITQFSKYRNLAAARALFDDLVASYPEQIDTFACRALIDAYKNARLPEEGKSAEREVAQGQKALVYQMVAEIESGTFRLRRQDSSFEALRVFERMGEWGVQPNRHIYHSLLHSFVLERGPRSKLLGVRESVLRTCLKLFKQMKGEGFEPDAVTYTILMTIFGAAAQPELAWGVYQELRQRAQEGGDGVALNQLQYGAILAVLVEGREVQKAFQVKDEMEAAGVQPDRISWCLLIRACTQVDQVYRAFTVFEEMAQSGCPPCTEAYNVLINACAAAGLEDRAWSLLDEMKAKGGECAPDIVTYNTMLKVCFDQPEKAQEILEEIVDEGLRPNIRTFNSVIDIYAQKHDAASARRVFGEMKNAGLPPNVVTYTSLMDAMMKSGDMDAAMGVLEEMKAAGVQPNKATYTVLLRIRPEWKLHYDVQRGMRLYEEMRAAGFAPNDCDFKNLMDRWAEEQIAARAQEEKRLSEAPTESRALTLVPANGIERPPMFLDLVMRKGGKEKAEMQELTIDLHGLSRPEARATVLSLLRTLQLRHAQGWKIQSDLTIITGRGIGSRITGIPVVRAAVLNLLREELGFPVIAWEPSPDLDDLNLETPKLRSFAARALAPEKIGSVKTEQGGGAGVEKSSVAEKQVVESDVEGGERNGIADGGSERGAAITGGENHVANYREEDGLADGVVENGAANIGLESEIAEGRRQDDESASNEREENREDAKIVRLEMMRRIGAGGESDPARELMAEAITAIAGHNEVEVNSLLVHGLGEPGIMKPLPEEEDWRSIDRDGEAAKKAKAELTAALLRTVEDENVLLDGWEDSGQSEHESLERSGDEATIGGASEEGTSARHDGNRYSNWSPDTLVPEEELSESEEGVSEHTQEEGDVGNVPNSFSMMPPELRERQLKRMKDAERWRQLEEELYYLGPYGQRLLYTRRKLKNQGRIIVPKDALLAWVGGKRKHGRQRRGKEMRKQQSVSLKIDHQEVV